MLETALRRTDSAVASRFAFWWRLAVALAIAIGGALVVAAVCDATVCWHKLVEVPEPAGWRAWPILPNQGNFFVDGDEFPVDHGLVHGMRNAELRDSTVCRGAGISVDQYFDAPGGPPRVVTVRESNGTYVISIRYLPYGVAPNHPEEAPDFFKAFRRVNTIPGLGFRHTWVFVMWMIFAACVLWLLTAGFRARRSLARVIALHDGAQYKPAERDGSGGIVFADGLPPLHHAGRPGPVLVRVKSVTEPTFRSAQETIASEVLDGDASTLGAKLVARATGPLRAASVASFVIAGFILLVAGAIHELNELFSF